VGAAAGAAAVPRVGSSGRWGMSGLPGRIVPTGDSGTCECVGFRIC
jgi:hypothetical protein